MEGSKLNDKRLTSISFSRKSRFLFFGDHKTQSLSWHVFEDVLANINSGALTNTRFRLETRLDMITCGIFLDYIRRGIRLRSTSRGILVQGNYTMQTGADIFKKNDYFFKNSHFWFLNPENSFMAISGQDFSNKYLEIKL